MASSVAPSGSSVSHRLPPAVEEITDYEEILDEQVGQPETAQAPHPDVQNQDGEAAEPARQRSGSAGASSARSAPSPAAKSARAASKLPPSAAPGAAVKSFGAPAKSTKSAASPSTEVAPSDALTE